MKKIYLTLFAISIITLAMAQAKPVETVKEFPATITITMTKGEFMRIDSAVGFYLNAIDSKTQTANYAKALQSFYNQVNKQLVVKPAKKP